MTYYNEKGIKRFLNAIVFSVSGLIATWKHEEAFRQEVIVFFMAVPLALWLGQTRMEVLALIGSVVLVMVAELLNSAIEAVVDRTGVEYHELAGRAKDMGSAAVMLLILFSMFTWIYILI